MRGIFDEGTLTLLHGTPGSGKTDFSWLIDKRAKLLGKNILTNKRVVPNCDFEYKRIDNDIHFFNYFLQFRKNMMVGLDEANLFQSSKSAMGKQEKTLEQFISIIRHFRSSIYFIIQRKENYLPMLREQATWEIRKIEKKMWELKNIKDEKDYYWNCPSAKEYNIKFETYSFANFYFWLDLKRMVRDISEKEHHKEQVKELQRISNKGYEGYRREE